MSRHMEGGEGAALLEKGQRFSPLRHFDEGHLSSVAEEVGAVRARDGDTPTGSLAQQAHERLREVLKKYNRLAK